jgi:long-chain acyl-CoA synthetase
LQVNHPVWDSIYFHDYRAMLGGRVRLIATGAAPISKEILDFLKIVLSAPIAEGYGQT